MNTEPTPAAASSPTPPQSQASILSIHTVEGAIECLQQSRRTMREQMLVLNAASRQAQAARQRAQQRPGVLRTTLSAIPVVGPLIDSAIAWWDAHPLRAVAELLASRKTSAAEPVTHRHPWAVLASAAAVGALLMWAQPWRHRFLRRAIYAGVIPRLFASLLSRLSADGLIKWAESLLRRPPPAPNSAATPAPTTATVPSEKRPA